MIPEFPQFKAVELTDKAEMDAHTRRFPPYNDFDFVTLYCWGKMRVAWLHGNMVVRFQPSAESVPHYSFLGINRVVETTKEVIAFQVSEGFGDVLEVVPAITVDAGDAELRECCDVLSDPDHNDYVISLDASLAPKDKRRKHRKFFREQPGAIWERLDLGSASVRAEIAAIWKLWHDRKVQDDHMMRAEFIAMTRCMEAHAALDIVGFGIRLAGRLVGFNLSNPRNDRWAMFHFCKADLTISSLFDTLVLETMREMREHGCIQANIFEDAGHPGLRQSKQGWKPIAFLEKFYVKPRRA